MFLDFSFGLDSFFISFTAGLRLQLTKRDRDTGEEQDDNMPEVVFNFCLVLIFMI